MKLRGEKEAFEQVLKKKIDGIKQRLTVPDMGEVKEDFIELVKNLSSGVAEHIKRQDASLERYRIHNQVGKDCVEERELLIQQTASFHEENPDLSADEISFLLDALNVVISARTELKQTYMLSFSL